MTSGIALLRAYEYTCKQQQQQVVLLTMSHKSGYHLPSNVHPDNGYCDSIYLVKAQALAAAVVGIENADCGVTADSMNHATVLYTKQLKCNQANGR